MTRRRQQVWLCDSSNEDAEAEAHGQGIANSSSRPLRLTVCRLLRKLPARDQETINKRAFADVGRPNNVDVTFPTFRQHVCLVKQSFHALTCIHNSRQGMQDTSFSRLQRDS